MVVLPDADLQKWPMPPWRPATATPAKSAFRPNASSQSANSYDDLLEILTPKVAALRTGDQLDPQTQMGPMVLEADAVRVAEWIEEARLGGARVLPAGSVVAQSSSRRSSPT